MTLEVVVARYEQADRPEKVVGGFRTLQVADVYLVLGYCLITCAIVPRSMSTFESRIARENRSDDESSQTASKEPFESAYWHSARRSSTRSEWSAWLSMRTLMTGSCAGYCSGDRPSALLSRRKSAY